MTEVASVIQKGVEGEKATLLETASPDEMNQIIDRLMQIDAELRGDDDHPDSTDPDIEGERTDSYIEGNLEMDDQEQREWLTPTPEHRVFLVSGSNLLTELSRDEIGKLQAWISVYSTPEERTRAEIATGELSPSITVSEVSYAKLKRAESGQVASALRQACLEMLADQQVIDPNAVEVITKEQDEITGYRINLLVTAFIEPENEASKKVLKSVGFVRQNQDVIYKEADRNDPKASRDETYILDWNFLFQKILNKSNRAIFGTDTELSSTIVPVTKQFPEQVLFSE